jgi:hypothetical protein
MKAWLRRWWWPLGKLLIALAILVGVSRQFSDNLRAEDLERVTLRPGWLAASGGLYLLGLGFSAWFWQRLMVHFGQRPALRVTAKAYFLGHLGKYVPGKAVSLLLRCNAVRGPEVKLSVAIITTFYEVFTTMAAGALLAAVLFALYPSPLTGQGMHPVMLGVLLLAVLGLPLLPGVFNFLVRRVVRRFRLGDPAAMPRMGAATLAEGLLLCGCGWALLGLSLWAMAQGITPVDQPLTVPRWARCTAMVGLSYVAGFAAFMLPAGLGAREYVLEPFLEPELADLVPAGQTAAVATALVLVLRLLWTGLEVLIALFLLCLPAPRRTEPPAEGCPEETLSAQQGNSP